MYMEPSQATMKSASTMIGIRTYVNSNAEIELTFHTTKAGGKMAAANMSKNG